jgi:hypothetical protein
MKVNGPGGGAGGADAPDAIATKTETKAPGGVEKPEAGGRTFAETLAAGRLAPGADAARVGGADALTADIAADLRAGKIDPKAALDRVVERVLDRQLGADAPVALRDQLRDALRDTISSDPFLTARLRGLD